MKKIISIITAACICFCSMGVNCVDIEVTPIEYLYEKGIFEGDATGELHPDNFITRAEICKIITLAFNLEKGKEPTDFYDIKNHWGKEYIDIMSSNGYVNGKGENRFDPDANVTYEEALAMITRADGVLNGNYPYGVLSYSVEKGISDNVAVITGRPASRSEVAQFLYNVITEREFYDEEISADNDMSVKTSSSSLNMNAAGGGSGGGFSAVTVTEEAVADDAAEAPALSGGAFYSPIPDGYYRYNTEEYSSSEENGFKNPAESPLSTFSLDVDTASYGNMRNKLLRGYLPEQKTLRTEELVNYFDYNLPKPQNGEPFSVYTEVAECPWNKENNLAMIALSGYELEKAEAPASNLVFLIDVSCSMWGADRLQLAQRAMLMLADELDENDKITIVTYSGSSAVALDTVGGNEKDKIKEAILSLRAGGSTNGAQGIITAYEKAEKAFIENGNNRVIICSDGDFNVGVTSEQSLEELITQKRKSGVYLSVLGFGMGNYKDNKMETLADCGNGNYAYIDSIKEAKKVLVDDMMSTIFTIAKDVKLRVEFNPAKVAKYRLIGYENRILNTEDFKDDTKDAGEMGAGHTMIAFYELVPNENGAVDTELKYQEIMLKESDDIFTVHLRYKKPESETSEAAEDIAVTEVNENPGVEFNFASAVAEFSMIMNNSEYKANASIENVLSRAYENRGEDKFGYRAEFIQLVNLAELLMR